VGECSGGVGEHGGGVGECSSGVQQWSGGVGEWGSAAVEWGVQWWRGVAYREKENGPDLMVVPMLCL